MNIFSDAFIWLNDPLNWTGSSGIVQLTIDHLWMSALATLAAMVIAIPLGVYLARSSRGGGLTVIAANTSRAFPTLALLTIFAISPIGFGNRATVLAVAAFAIPPILTNVYVGMREVDADILDAARGTGMSPAHVLGSVQLPLAVPTIAAGVRTAAVQVVATVPLAALVGGGGLGVIIVTGMSNQNYGKAMAGGLLVAALCLALEGLLALGQRWVTPKSLRTATVTA
ncbi:MAG TPA: ABC transporter permease subunit [Actinomycetales bacterium]|nr:ABC transporter permease subunit [Actinomycetales bacterium]